MIFPTHDQLAQPLRQKNQKDARDESVDGVEAGQCLEWMIVIPVYEEIGDKQ